MDRASQFRDYEFPNGAAVQVTRHFFSYHPGNSILTVYDCPVKGFPNFPRQHCTVKGLVCGERLEKERAALGGKLPDRRTWPLNVETIDGCKGTVYFREYGPVVELSMTDIMNQWTADWPEVEE